MYIVSINFRFVYIIFFVYSDLTAIVIGLGGLITCSAIKSLFLYLRFKSSSNTQKGIMIDIAYLEDVYDEIEDDALYDDNVLVGYSERSITSTNSEGPDKNNYLTPCCVAVETYNENTVSENENRQSELPCSTGGGGDSEYLHPYCSLIPSPIETQQNYISLQHGNIARPVHRNPSLTSTYQTGKETEYSARRWSFTLNELPFALTKCQKPAYNHLKHTCLKRK